MKVGEIFKWTTTKAIGHKLRQKYHLFIKCGDWCEDNIFLFISSSDYGGDYKITNPPYICLQNSESYISCGSIITYTDTELAALNLQSIGSLAHEHLRELLHSVANSNLMERGHKRLVCEALSHLSR